MKKIVAVLSLISVSLYSTPLKADNYKNSISIQNAADVPAEPAVENPDNTSEQQNATVPHDAYTAGETLVSPESSDQEKKAKNKKWQNIIIAISVAVVAITAILLVHSHEGRSRHNHHR